MITMPIIDSNIPFQQSLKKIPMKHFPHVGVEHLILKDERKGDDKIVLVQSIASDFDNSQ
jgi:hypothetical protein